MATLTRVAVSFAGGLCTWEYDYDDVALILTRVRCSNQSEEPTKGTAIVQKNGRTFTRTVAAGGSLDQALPTGPAFAFDITIDAEGNVHGVDWYAEHGAQVA
jgi:hypothetical protein